MSVNRVRAVESCRNWNAVFPPGTPVVYAGLKAKTWSFAGLGMKDVPCVFLDIKEQTPIPLDLLEVPGWERSAKKRTNERPKQQEPLK
jgi:hypothetical protein